MIRKCVHETIQYHPVVSQIDSNLISSSHLISISSHPYLKFQTFLNGQSADIFGRVDKIQTATRRQAFLVISSRVSLLLPLSCHPPCITLCHSIYNRSYFVWLPMPLIVTSSSLDASTTFTLLPGEELPAVLHTQPCTVEVSQSCSPSPSSVAGLPPQFTTYYESRRRTPSIMVSPQFEGIKVYAQHCITRHFLLLRTCNRWKTS
jgi:hypothetical protein